MDKFLLQVFPGIGGYMAKQADHYRDVPEYIYVVATEKSYRIYTAEGHALNWFAKQSEQGLNPILKKYASVEEQKAQIN